MYGDVGGVVGGVWRCGWCSGGVYGDVGGVVGGVWRCGGGGGG